MSYPIYSSPLLAHVQKLLQERPANLQMQELARDCNISRVRLTAFKNGRADNINALTLERLYVRLTGKQIISHDTE
jgi:DNA-binding Xre family transcriptional regulator